MDIKDDIIKYINVNYIRNKTTYLQLYKELSLIYNIPTSTIKLIHYNSNQYIKQQKYHLKMDKIIAKKVKSNPHNLEQCFRELSSKYNETFKYFKNRYYRYVKFKYKLFYIEGNNIKLYNIKQIPKK